MNRHEEMNRLLVDFALGELSPQTQADLRTHLDECRQCRLESERLEALLECTQRMGELSADRQACESAERAVLEVVWNQKDKQQTSGPNRSPGFIRRIT
ncbi:MAG: anti-sigma factor family protein, partial [Planctomycetota bacterium]